MADAKITLHVTLGEPFRLDDLCTRCWCAATWAQLMIMSGRPSFIYTCTNCQISAVR